MNVTALVMAGGKGTRMALNQEKPLLELGGKAVIDHVLEALKQAKKVDAVVVAVTDYTPKTAKHLAKFSVTILKTPGKEYVSDMGFAVRKLGLQTIITISSDMPLLTGEIVDDILEEYTRCSKSALTVVVPAETKKKLGMSLGYAFTFEGKQVVPSGINVNNGARIEDPELDQAFYLLDKVEVAVNINTFEEYKAAQKLFRDSS